MSKKSWWVIAAALSLTPLAACEAPGARPGEEPEQQQPTGAGIETDPATGTDVEGGETDPTTGGGMEGGGAM